jgi:toxin ParE1/3/4
VTSRAWEVRLTADAAVDFDSILLWTAKHFGLEQAQVYAHTLADALAALRDGPEIVGAKQRRDVDEALYSLHVARNGRRGRHFILYRVALNSDRPTIDILRLLHDAIDLSRYAPTKDDLE